MKRNHTSNREPRSGVSPYRRYDKVPYKYMGRAATRRVEGAIPPADKTDHASGRKQPK